MHDLTATLSHVVCQGVQRMRLLDFIPAAPFLTARSLEIPQPARSSAEIAARLLNLRRLSIGAARLLPEAPRELIVALESTEPAGALADPCRVVHGHQAEGKAGDPGVGRPSVCEVPLRRARIGHRLHRCVRVEKRFAELRARVPDLAVEPLKVGERERRLEKMRRSHCKSSR